MSEKKKPAAKKRGPKLTPNQVHYVRAVWKDKPAPYWRKLAKEWGVLHVSLRRIASGSTYKPDHLKKRESLETKPCIICRKFVSRRFPGGSRKSDRMWKLHRTCGHSCAQKLNAQSEKNKIVEGSNPRGEREVAKA